MEKIIIGSTALKHWYPDLPRIPKDIDYIIENKNDWESVKDVEYLENPEIYLNQDKYTKDGYITPNVLYTLKISHVIGWDLNNNSWSKHIFDIHFLNKKGCKIDRELFDKFYNYWGKLHGKNKRSDLEMSAEDFFNNKIDSPHEHDYLHTLINPSPTFNKILKDEVEVCEDKIKSLTFDEKCDLVREEVMVMASERYKGMNFRSRYVKMLKKFILSYAPIDVGIFTIENYPLLERPLFNFMEVINKKLKEQGLQTLN